MMNIGTNPTFNRKNQSIEIHFLDFNKNIYNQSLSVEMITRIRSEKKFSSVENLKKQLELDKVTTLSYIDSLNI